MAVDYSVSYDPGRNSLIDLVRFAIQDVTVDVGSNVPSAYTPRSQWSVLFTDQEIVMTSLRYGTLANQADVTAAELLENIASNTALLAKHIVLGDYASDTRSAAKGLRDQADWLRNRYGKALAAGGEEPAESVSTETWTDFDYRRLLYSGNLR